MGARVLKELTLRDGHPFLYQRHIFEGGAGALPVANHAMVRLPTGARISYSPKRWAETPTAPLEGDPQARALDPRLSRPLDRPQPFPARRWRHRRPDLLSDRPGPRGFCDAGRSRRLAARLVGRDAPGEGDMALMLKNPARLPVTMLWYSNGGRSYAPWNGRHRDVLGVEDGCTWSLYGHAASIARNALSDIGIPTALRLDPDGRRRCAACHRRRSDAGRLGRGSRCAGRRRCRDGRPMLRAPNSACPSTIAFYPGKPDRSGFAAGSIVHRLPSGARRIDAAMIGRCTTLIMPPCGAIA